MDLICYLFPNWAPRIRSANSRRDWMDNSVESFAYRCLPLSIANAHGWEILSPCGFEAVWNGGPNPDDVAIRVDEGTAHPIVPVALFGQATLTFHVEGIMRTPPGWNLWVGGCPNIAKDGIAPLSGIIETDWSPYSFTMNWRFTRANHPVRFEENEPFCFFFPVQRQLIEAVQPHFQSIEAAPELKAQYQEWSQSRDAFQADVAAHPPSKPSDKWQKLYYRGVDANGEAQVDDHKSKLRIGDFDSTAAAGYASPKCPVAHSARGQQTAAAPAPDAPTVALSKCDWMIRTQAELRGLSPAASGIFRKEGVTGQMFLDEYYARNHPVVLANAVAEWPAHKLWSPTYLRTKIGDALIEAQVGRTSDPQFERYKDAHKQTLPFSAFVDQIMCSGAGNDLYVTAYNSASNRDALSILHDDLGMIEGIIDPLAENARGMMWIGPADTFTPLHHDLTNNLLLQITGRKRVIMAAPSDTWRLYNDHHVFSEIIDLQRSDLDFERFPLLQGVTLHEIILEPGDALFLPVGWWHQVTALDFSVSITHTNFVWPNDAHSTYPT
ncbi:DUF6065 family protein [Sphingomonas echinoides]|uniref:DUF6065 family protein n=1 Tax=Sphingomonas echinoides TaxID=59803 RepID=A0ABU4PKS0_9SPHN|nr:DUF6065 family protein [Sphingomonas echinoides]MDX5983678.1 DUF6065 family protein [Sphingomonas echinoides]